MTTPLAVSLETVNLLYAVSAVLLVFGIKQLSSPRTARQGNFVAAAGMAIAVGITLFHPDVEKYGLMAVGIAVGTVIGVVSARAVKMTAIPQLVALFNGGGGGAGARIAAAA